MQTLLHLHLSNFLNFVVTASYIVFDGVLRFAVGGPVFGYVMARCCLLWLSKTFNDSLSEIAATFTTAFLTFFIGKYFHIS